jgi:hypothetical protein
MDDKDIARNNFPISEQPRGEVNEDVFNSRDAAFKFPRMGLRLSSLGLTPHVKPDEFDAIPPSLRTENHCRQTLG